MRAEDFAIVEINGIGGEAIDCWDPHLGVRECYRRLATQQTLLFQIGMDEHGIKIQETAKKQNLTPQALVEWMSMAGFGVAMFMFLYVLIILLLGTIIDSSSIMLIVLPLMLPIAQQFGLNLVWFGVVTVVAVEIGLLTPPFGLSVFVVKSSLDGTVPLSIGDVFRGTAPFTLMMTGVLVILLAFPSLSLVLLK